MISMSKKYKTVSGCPVRILCVDKIDPTYVILGLVLEHGLEAATMWNIEGKRLIGGIASPYDLVEIKSWDNFELDKKVLFKAHPMSDWVRGHFAGDRDGKPCVFNGGTSWTTPNDWIVVHEIVDPSQITTVT
jgi:hypothetical protein